ncbi:hypothetical protein PSHT_09986, partial [Puccinia striiformis]
SHTGVGSLPSGPGACPVTPLMRLYDRGGSGTLWGPSRHRGREVILGSRWSPSARRPCGGCRCRHLGRDLRAHLSRLVDTRRPRVGDGSVAVVVVPVADTMTPPGLWSDGTVAGAPSHISIRPAV